MSDSDLAEIFEEEFGRPPSSVEARAAQAALGDEYPDGLNTYSWVSRTELRRTADQVKAIDARELVDLGCGRGGPGLWVARTTRRRLTGLDIAESALAQGRALAAEMGVEAEFRLGSFEDTGLTEASADLVMSFDAFLFTPDKEAAFHELARILRPGGRLVMTSWDFHTQPQNRPPQIADHSPLAEAAGLEVLEYDETEDWQRRCTVFVDYLLEHADEAAREAGVSPQEMREGIADVRQSMDCMARRFLLVARRPEETLG